MDRHGDRFVVGCHLLMVLMMIAAALILLRTFWEMMGWWMFAPLAIYPTAYLAGWAVDIFGSWWFSREG